MITQNDDIIDSRDVIQEIEEILAIDPSERTDEESEQLLILQKLAEDAAESPDWEYGEQLIRDSYFAHYAQELAEDCGLIDSNATWPMAHIDWDAAANDLKQDYFSVGFDGVKYWIRY